MGNDRRRAGACTEYPTDRPPGCQAMRTRGATSPITFWKQTWQRLSVIASPYVKLNPGQFRQRSCAQKPSGKVSMLVLNRRTLEKKTRRPARHKVGQSGKDVHAAIPIGKPAI